MSPLANATDELLPVPHLVEKPTRQARRKAERGQSSCRHCYMPVSAAEVVFGDGRPAHRGCSEAYNAEVDRVRLAHRRDRVEKLGLHVVTAADMLSALR